MENVETYSSESMDEGDSNYNQFQVMWDQFAVAMVKIVADEELTLLCGNQAFFAMTGYTKEEFKEKFHNKTKEIIGSEDFIGIIKAFMKNSMGETIEHNLRIRTKDQSEKWLFFKAKGSYECDKEQRQVFYCIFTDITKPSEIQERLRVEEERFRLISEISDDITFEYDVKTDNMYFGRRYEEIFHKKPVIRNYQSYIMNDNFIEKESKDSFLSIFRIRKKVNAKYYTELKINSPENKSEWYGLHYAGIFDEDNGLIKLIGKLVNIDKQVREKEFLLMKSQVDPMTKLYNKITAEKEITQHLSTADEYSLGAMLIIDVDDFKSINDSLGHLFGDAVLKDIAKNIKKIFREKDVMGRIGGDEFIIYMKDISSKQIVNEKAQSLCDAISALYKNSKWGTNLSVSIGISMQEGKLHTYSELFQNADIALYHAKEMGKNCFVIFRDEVNRNEVHNSELLERETRDLVVRSNRDVYHNLIKLSLTTLNSANDFTDRMNRTIELIGKSMNVCKVVLGLLNRSNEMVYKYQWVQTGKVRKESLAKKNALKLEKFESRFNSQGIFYCNDTDNFSAKMKVDLVVKDAKSLLYFKIVYQGKLIGTLGIQSCIEKRLWVDNEVETINILAQILGGYITSDRGVS